MKTVEIEGWQCDYVEAEEAGKLVYMIYPALVPLSAKWLQTLSKKYAVSIAVVYVAAEKWNDVLTPWAEPGEAKGFPSFAGEAPRFLQLLKEKIIPGVEGEIKLASDFERLLIGVSLSGLFALWEWLQCDIFKSIGCLSGSFWYVGFMDWFDSQTIPQKAGKAFFLLGEKEPEARIKAYQSVGANTSSIVERLRKSGIDTEFEWVAGDHFSAPLHRAEKAFEWLVG